VSQSSRAQLTVPTAQDMHALGTEIGRALLAFDRAAQCVGIEGDLGAGKTTLVGGVLAAAGFEGPVRSPTYTLIEPYARADRTIYHLDLYRLADPGEVEPLGIRDLLVPGAILLIEWPSRGAGMLPRLDLEIHIGYRAPPESGREVSLVAGSEVGSDLLARLLQ